VSQGKEKEENNKPTEDFQILNIIRGEDINGEPGLIQEIHYADKSGESFRMYLSPPSEEA
jgi:hypothetical protein